MKLWNWLRGHTKVSPELYEKAALLREIESARKDWSVAQERLNYVVEHEQVDYAIYLLEAAEKRYEMLLRQAKRQQLNVKELNRVPMAEGWQ